MTSTEHRARPVPAGTASAAVGPAAGPAPPGRRRWPLHLVPTVGLVAGLAATGALTAASRIDYLHTESRLASMQARLTADALAVAPVDVERRLGRAVGLAAATGDPTQFGQSMTGSLATGAAAGGAHGPFADVDLLRLTATGPVVLDHLGGAPLLAPTGRRATVMAARAAAQLSAPATAAAPPTLVVTRVVAGSRQRLVYAMAATGPGGSLVAEAEQVLPADRRVRVPPSNPDAGLRVAVYFGRTASPGALIEANAPVPLAGPRTAATVPFGTAVLTLVVSPEAPLAGALAPYVAWAIAVFGAGLTVVAAAIAEWLVRRRRRAEEDAAHSRRLYQAQRSVSETLQHSLLPRRLPEEPTLALDARYLPGTAGIDVGGDWYDVLAVAPGRVFFTVGDVAGHGVEAAVQMAALRHAITAHARDGDAPATVLAKVSRLVDMDEDRLATVLCGLLDTRTGVAVLASAGHPPAVLASGRDCRTVDVPVGPPAGVGDRYEQASVPLPPGATVLCYTDGLVERRGEPVTDGVARLCRAVLPDLALPALLDHLLVTLVPHGSDDDLALLGLRWRP